MSAQPQQLQESELQESDIRWVVNDVGELGVKINGKSFFFYKGQSISYDDNPRHRDGTSILVREVGEREFGETIFPRSWQMLGPLPDRYNLNITHTPGPLVGPDAWLVEGPLPKSAVKPRHRWEPILTQDRDR